MASDKIAWMRKHFRGMFVLSCILISAIVFFSDLGFWTSILILLIPVIIDLLIISHIKFLRLVMLKITPENADSKWTTFVLKYVSFFQKIVIGWYWADAKEEMNSWKSNKNT